MKSSNLANPQVSTDDFPFQHYSLRHHAISWVSRNLFDRFSYTVRHGLIRGMKRTGGLGWTPAWLSRVSETKEDMFWRQLPLRGLVVYDIGAFHGMLTLFFASRCKQVISYEPNDANHTRLVENIRLNDLTNVLVRQLAVGSHAQSGTLRYSPSMAGGGSLAPNVFAQVSQPVEVTTLDDDIAYNALPAPDLIKIDIEGWELEALIGARATLDTHHPALFLEMHGETMAEKKRKVREIVAFLYEAKYVNILHVETGAAIAPGNETLAAEGHLFCRYTPK